MDTLKAYHISNWHSEPYHQNRNPAERRYRTIKSWTSTVMNRSGAPANCWLLCMIYVCYISNHIACGALNGSIPLLVLYGITPDTSITLLYILYQSVFYATHDQHFPSESEERAAFLVGSVEHCGDAMTIKLWIRSLRKSYTEVLYSQLPNQIATIDLLKMEGRPAHQNNQVLKSQLSLSDQDRMMLIHLTSSLCLNLILMT